MNTRKFMQSVTMAAFGAAMLATSAAAQDHDKGDGNGHDKDRDKQEKREYKEDKHENKQEDRRENQNGYGPVVVQQHGNGNAYGHYKDSNGRPGNFRFRGDDDRVVFQRYYSSDIGRWDKNPRRARFVVGQVIPRTYVVQAVPQAYYQNVPPPPPGYNYGYSNGYVVAYNPTTRIIADVLDLVSGTTRR